MAAPHLEPGRTTDLVDELQQILDRNIKESRCLDLESLCIQAEESVWQLRLDVTILNHAGNLGDACNLASVAALKHFHRPDVTVEADGRVTVHTLEEREPIPTFMRKVPVCLTYAFFMQDTKCHVIMDPTEKEERVMCGKLVVGLNPHGEVTSLLFPGRVALQREILLSCIHNAFSKAKATAEAVQQAVEDDLAQRKASSVKPLGFVNGKLRSDTGYNRWLISRAVTQRRLNVMDEVPMEEGASTSPIPNGQMSPSKANSAPSDPTLPETPSPETLNRDTSVPMDSDGSNDDDDEDEEEEEEEEEMETKLTANDLL